VLRLAGLSVNTGTVNDPELLLRMIGTVAPDAVCSDRPDRLRREAEALAARTGRERRHRYEPAAA
jgi:hypothetical protein